MSKPQEKNKTKLDKQSLKAFRINEARNNIAFFASYYFSHYCHKDFSDLHFHLFDTFKKTIDEPKGQRLVQAAPRGNAKSSIASLILPLWCILFEKKRFIILISDTAGQANDFLSNIRQELENNQKILEDFGDLTGEQWRQDDIITKNDVRVLALGARKKIRGRRYKNFRPDLIVGDDIENDENTANPEQRKKNENWFFKAVSKAGDETTDIIVVGTIIHYDSLLSKLLKNPIYQGKKWQAIIQESKSNKWEQWEQEYLKDSKQGLKFYKQNQEDMLKGVKVLWEDEQPYYRLREIKLSEGSASFDSEYQNNPINPEDCLFQEEWFTFFEKDQYTEIIGSCDPSMGKNNRADYSVIIFLGKTKEGYLDVLLADVARRHPDQIIDEIISSATEIQKMYSQTPIRTFAVESVAFQEYFKDRLNVESRKRGLYLPVVSTENQTTRKEIRIQTLQPLVKNGVIRFQPNQRLLLEQLKYYPLADHDDAPDALEMAVRKARTPILTSKTY